MTIVSDFVVVQGDKTATIGDNQVVWESRRFGAGGRVRNGQAILTFMVKGLTQARDDVDVKINGKSVGTIFRYNGADPAHWHTQIINIGPDVLNNGPNTLQLVAVGVDGDGVGGNNFDDFYVRDIICFFQQEV